MLVHTAITGEVQPYKVANEHFRLENLLEVTVALGALSTGQEFGFPRGAKLFLRINNTYPYCFDAQAIHNFTEHFKKQVSYFEDPSLAHLQQSELTPEETGVLSDFFAWCAHPGVRHDMLSGRHSTAPIVSVLAGSAFHLAATHAHSTNLNFARSYLEIWQGRRWGRHNLLQKLVDNRPQMVVDYNVDDRRHPTAAWVLSRVRPNLNIGFLPHI